MNDLEKRSLESTKYQALIVLLYQPGKRKKQYGYQCLTSVSAAPATVPEATESKSGSPEAIAQAPSGQATFQVRREEVKEAHLRPT